MAMREIIRAARERMSFAFTPDGPRGPARVASEGVVYAAQMTGLPIVPIAFAEEPQPGWAVQLAFLLRSVELTTAIVAILALVLSLGTWARDRLRRGAL